MNTAARLLWEHYEKTLHASKYLFAVRSRLGQLFLHLSGAPQLYGLHRRDEHGGDVYKRQATFSAPWA